MTDTETEAAYKAWWKNRVSNWQGDTDPYSMEAAFAAGHRFGLEEAAARIENDDPHLADFIRALKDKAKQ